MTDQLPCATCPSMAICNALIKDKLGPNEDPTDLNITVAFATALLTKCGDAADYLDEQFYTVRKTQKLKEVTASELRKVYDFNKPKDS